MCNRQYWGATGVERWSNDHQSQVKFKEPLKKKEEIGIKIGVFEI